MLDVVVAPRRELEPNGPSIKGIALAGVRPQLVPCLRWRVHMRRFGRESPWVTVSFHSKSVSQRRRPSAIPGRSRLPV